MLRVLAIALLWPFCGMAAPTLTVSGSPEVVFDWQTERCATWDIPDAPARALRTPSSEVLLIAGAETTRAARGPGLNMLARDCRVLHRGAGADDPAEWDDRTWIASVHAAESGDIVALGHMEYHGHLRRDRCPAGDYAACWFNAIVELRSTDGGRSFARTGGGSDLVAALPYRYSGDGAGRSGYFNPSNILQRGDHLYAFIFAEASGAQQRGVCLIRRPQAGGPHDWRAWDGSGFSARFVDPYREQTADPARHVCTPLAGLSSTLSSVVRLSNSGLYLGVTPATLRDAQGRLRSGIFWTTSVDLITWTKPQLVHEVPLLWRRDCARPAAYAYPSLIDPDSPSRNYDTADENLWLYLVEFRLDAACRTGPDRDLLRIRVVWTRA